MTAGSSDPSRPPGDADPSSAASVVHQVRPGHGLTVCCGRSLFELPIAERVSCDGRQRTCSAAVPAVLARLAVTDEQLDGWEARCGTGMAGIGLGEQRALLADTRAARRVIAELVAELTVLRPALRRARGAAERERRLAREAKAVMATLEQHGPGIVGHLLDTDDNAGQRLREAVAASAAAALDPSDLDLGEIDATRRQVAEANRAASRAVVLMTRAAVERDRAQLRIRRALAVCGIGVEALASSAAAKRRVSVARVREALIGGDER